MIPSEDLPFYGRPRHRDTRRYWLHRDIGNGNRGNVLFILLNPSKALSLGETDRDGDNDRTVKRCIRFARAWGYRCLTVVNLFAFRAANPDELLRHPNYLIDPDNDAAIEWALRQIQEDVDGKVVCGWGNSGTVWCRNCYVLDFLNELGIQGHCLGRTKRGHPKHPGRVAADTELIEMPN